MLLGWCQDYLLVKCQDRQSVLWSLTARIHGTRSLFTNGTNNSSGNKWVHLQPTDYCDRFHAGIPSPAALKIEPFRCLNCWVWCVAVPIMESLSLGRNFRCEIKTRGEQEGPNCQSITQAMPCDVINPSKTLKETSLFNGLKSCF